MTTRQVQENKTRTQTIAEQLREKILAGEFAPDERMQEVQLAEKMHVSRTPIREALRILAEDGLLVHQPNKGYTVRKFSPRDVIIAYRVRGAMESLGVRMLAERGLASEEKQKLEALLAEGDKLLASGKYRENNFQPWFDMNRKIHVYLLVLADSELLTRVAREAQSIPIVNARSFQWYSERDFHLTHHHHHMIVDAISRQQPERAAFYMQEHIDHGRSVAERVLRSVTSAEQKSTNV